MLYNGWGIYGLLLYSFEYLASCWKFKCYEAKIEEGFFCYYLVCRRSNRLHTGRIIDFVTGADKIPPHGFNEMLSLEFLHSCDKMLPTTSMCSITMRIMLQGVWLL